MQMMLSMWMLVARAVFLGAFGLWAVYLSEPVPKITACAGGTTNEFYKYRMQFCIVSRRNVISQFNVTEKVSNILNISIVVLFYGLISKHAEHIHLCDNSQKHLLTMSSQKH